MTRTEEILAIASLMGHQGRPPHDVYRQIESLYLQGKTFKEIIELMSKDNEQE
jgi:hypothetical protein